MTTDTQNEASPALALATGYALPRSIYADKLCARLGGIEYEWFGGFGAVLKSCENGISDGAIRMIGGVPFYAAVYRRRFRKDEVCWTIPNDHISAAWIRGFKARLFAA